MNNQDTLFPIIKDDITFDTLLTQAKTVIEQQAGKNWSDTGENDPGITLLEACCYGASDLAYRHSLSLKDILTPKQEEQTPGDGIFPKEFGPQQILTCGPITEEDYRRALLDLHSNDKSDGYFFFNDAQLIREPEKKLYEYWYNKEKREYSFKNSGSDSQLTLKGNYWLYLRPNRETYSNNKNLTLVYKKLKDFLKDNRNLGESVSKIIWLKPVDLPLKIDIQLNDDAKDIADIFAKVYMAAEQMVLGSPLRYTTQDMIKKGYSNEQIFEGPYLRHGWIPELPQIKDYTHSTVLNLSPLVNQLLAIKGVQGVTRLELDKYDTDIISPLPDDHWSWKITQGHCPILWYKDLLASITSSLTMTAKGGVKIVVTEQQIKEKIITEPLINTQPELLNWGKHRKVRDYYPASNKLPACYGLQTNTQQQVQLHQFMLPFEQMLANSCDELALLQKLLAFKQRGNTIYGAQWPFQTNTVGQKIHQKIKPELIKKLNDDSKINNNSGIHQQNYAKELKILNHLLEYFGTHCAAKSLTLNALDFLSTQRGYLAQQPELAYQRNNIRIDKVSALQKRIAARIGLGGKCFEEKIELDKFPFYLIEHRQLLPIKPDVIFDKKQKPNHLEIKNDPDSKNHLLIITQQGTAGQLLHGQVINLIIIKDKNSIETNDIETNDIETNDIEFTLRGQMITDIKEDSFYLNTRNSTDLEHNLNRVKKAFQKGKLRWENSPVWMEDMDYQLVHADETHQNNKEEDELWITSSPHSPFPAMIEENDEITLKYVISPYKPSTGTSVGSESPSDYILKACVKEFDRIRGRIKLKKCENQQNNFPLKAEAWRYRWYFSSEKYAHTDRFSFVVSIVINRELIENDNVDPHKLESWVKNEILAEFPAHISMIIHWLSPKHFVNFASTYKRWQNNGAHLGDEAYKILETLTLGRLPSGLTGIGSMRIATIQQHIEVIVQHKNKWNEEAIKSNQLLYVPYAGEHIPVNTDSSNEIPEIILNS
ncbi:hypothetical protein [Photorhabdus khanii]|uniref:Uncharacterized protein n=1 Tax=Photorhabdus khanii subsp. guanajuatensis TaxID=2100166 RepID=A0A4R4JRU0_9GAMM|nr:hypothetical protein [Photorhabdus khanii]TDB57284.1 hypothetical protein C5467_11615 [Photorhabdus khanii subsp. guanajuatensis]